MPTNKQEILVSCFERGLIDEGLLKTAYIPDTINVKDVPSNQLSIIGGSEIFHNPNNSKKVSWKCKNGHPLKLFAQLYIPALPNHIKQHFLKSHSYVIIALNVDYECNSCFDYIYYSSHELPYLEKEKIKKENIYKKNPLIFSNWKKTLSIPNETSGDFFDKYDNIEHRDSSINISECTELLAEKRPNYVYKETHLSGWPIFKYNVGCNEDWNNLFLHINNGGGIYGHIWYEDNLTEIKTNKFRACKPLKLSFGNYYYEKDDYW